MIKRHKPARPLILVAGLHDQVDAGITEQLADGRTPSETVDALREKVSGHLRRLTSCLRNELLPQLAEHGVTIEELAPWEQVDYAFELGALAIEMGESGADNFFKIQLGRPSALPPPKRFNASQNRVDQARGLTDTP